MIQNRRPWHGWKVLAVLIEMFGIRKQTTRVRRISGYFEDLIMYRFMFSLIVILILPVRLAGAVTVVQCEDEAGNRTFQTNCPPGSKLIEKLKLQTKTQPTPQAPDIVPTVYVAPKCQACDLVVQFFQTRKIDIEKKNIENNPEVQKELKGIVGNLKVPTIIIGSKVLSDYYPSDLTQALTQAGFPGLDQGKQK